MDINNDIKLIDLSLYLKKEKTLVIADIHIGYEEALNKQGVLVPRFQFKELMQRLEKILKKVKPKIVVVNGDLKHEFGLISETEWRHTLRFLDLIGKYVKKIILVRGNHDTILGPIAKKRNIEIVEEFMVNNVLIVHGHKIPKLKKGIKTIIMGHEHPALSLTDYPRTEIYKTFLIGKFKRRDLVVMPSFFLVNEGTDVLKERLLSPLIKNVRTFRAIIVSDKLYDFGEIRKIKNK